MTPAEARQLLHEDALIQREQQGLSVSEWEERISEEKHLREATALAGARTIDAITRFVWQWDRQDKKRKRR